MLKGLNHLTLAVTQLPRSVDFYHHTLGLTLNARWETGAYLSLPGLWLCLSLDSARAPKALPEYTHYAFTVSEADFSSVVEQLKAHGVQEWRQNRSEGLSFYFLDPDGHKLEIHAGSLASRLESCWQAPYSNMEIFVYPGEGE